MPPFFERSLIGYFIGAWIIGGVLVARFLEGSTGYRILMGVVVGAFVGFCIYGSMWAYEAARLRTGDD